MDIYQYRRNRLLDLIDKNHAGVRVSFCNLTGMSEARLAQLLSPTYRKGMAFSEKTARKLEVDAGLPKMYFDQGAADVIGQHSSALPPAPQAGDLSLIHASPEEIRLLTDYRMSDQRGRDTITATAKVVSGRDTATSSRKQA